MSVLIVVPAHNEEDSIAASLEAIRGALCVAGAPDGTIVVVCDSCTDGTVGAALAALDGTDHLVVEVDYRNVGAARDYGVRYGLEMKPETQWIAFTDADSSVSPTWIARQWAIHLFGYDAYCGRVSFDRSNSLLAAFWQRYETQTEDRIHGANMGLSVEAYRAVNGIPHLCAHEDRTLVDNLQTKGKTIFWDADVTVATSTRIVGRAPEGFAATLQKFSQFFGESRPLIEAHGAQPEAHWVH